MSVSEAPSLAAAQAAGFPLAGEDLAIDLANTLITSTDPPTDLLDDPVRVRTFWKLQADRLPLDAPVPSPIATRRLRAAVRELLEAQIGGREPAATALEDVTAAAAAAPVSERAVLIEGRLVRRTRWHAEHPQDLALAVVARAVIALVTDPERCARMRECANPSCSMLFEAVNTRRVWCTANICGNRARVSRHYARRRSE